MSVSRTPRVLIMDDNHEISLAMNVLLERVGFEVAVAPTAERALELQHRLPADVLIADTLGQPDFIMTIGRFRKEFPGTRIVATVRGFKRTAGIEGADVTLRKPFESEALLDALRELTEGQRRATVP